MINLLCTKTIRLYINGIGNALVDRLALRCKKGWVRSPLTYILIAATTLVFIAADCYSQGREKSGWIQDFRWHTREGKEKVPAILKTTYPESSHHKGLLDRREEGDELEAAAVLIEDITFRRVRNGREIVLVRANRFFEPKVFSIGGKRPRAVIDIKKASPIRKGLSKINVNGKMIRRIRSHFHADSRTLRIVLDLRPSEKSYKTMQALNMDDNRFVLEVVGEGALVETGDKGSHERAKEAKALKKPQKEIGPLPGPVLIEDIRFRKSRGGAEVVFIHPNRFFEPKIFAIEGKRPRAVIDIRNASCIRTGLSKIDVNGKMIRRIRSHFYADSHTLRIVLDFQSSTKAYMADQVFYEDANIYSLVITEG